MHQDLSRLLNELLQVSLHKDCEILVLINKVYPDREIKNGVIENDQTFLWELVPKKSGRGNRFHILHQENTPFMLQKHEQLAAIISGIHTNAYERKGAITKAKRYFLATWDHGSAFGIFKRFLPGQSTDTLSGSVKSQLVQAEERTITTQDVQSLGTYKPKNIQYLNRFTQVPIERRWEHPIHQYTIPKLGYQFQLDTSDRSQRLYHKLLTQKQGNADLRLEVKNNALSLAWTAVQPTRARDMFHGYQLSEDEWQQLESKLTQHGPVVSMEDTVPVEPLVKPFDILTNQELAQVLAQGFSGKRVDVLLMYNCIMMNVHTCYALRRNVDYLIAPQSMIEAPGYNYAEILQGIYNEVQNGHTAVETILRICINTFYNGSRIREQNKIDQWAVLCLQLQHFETLTKTLNNITERLLQEMEKNFRLKSIFATARNRCFQFDEDLNYYQIDFNLWLNEVIYQLSQEPVIPDALLKDLIAAQNEINRTVNKAIPVKRIGPLTYNKVLQAGMITYEPTGLSIYFPPLVIASEDSYRYFINPHSHNQCAFLHDHPKWLELVDKVTA